MYRLNLQIIELGSSSKTIFVVNLFRSYNILSSHPSYVFHSSMVDSNPLWFEQALGVGDGQRSLVCCSPRGCKEFDTIERLN